MKSKFADDTLDFITINPTESTKITTFQKDIKGLVEGLLMTPVPQWSNGVIRTYIVDGEIVRVQFDKTFIEGGNGMAYGEGSDRINELGIVPFIPTGEIWLEDGMQGDWPLIMLHEIVEWNEMKAGKKYDPAHTIAEKFES